MDKFGQGLSSTFFNRTHIYLKEMIDLFLDYKMNIYYVVDFYIEKKFSNNEKKIKEFLYFQDTNSLLKNYYCNKNVSEFDLLYISLLSSLKEELKIN